jgi:hypothetical protein
MGGHGVATDLPDLPPVGLLGCSARRFRGVERRRWQGKLEHHQLYLGRIVDIGAELYAMSASCVYAKALRAERGDSAIELADAFCRQSRRRVEHLLRQLWHNSDASDRGTAKHVLDDRYTWLEDGIVDCSIEGPWIADATPGPTTRDNVRRIVLRNNTKQPF